MLDLKLIRENPDLVRESQRRRGEDPAVVAHLLAIDTRNRALKTEAEALRAERKRVSAEIPKIHEAAERAPKVAAMREVGERITAMEHEITATDDQIRTLLLSIPNIPHESVPEGKDDSENIVIRTWGTPRAFDFPPRPHWEIAEALGIADFERGGKISGPRFFVLVGAGAHLERALINYFLDLHVTEHGYTEVNTPYLVKGECMVGTGQLPKFADDMYRIEGEDLYLDPTAEVPVTNLYRDEILDAAQLPIYLVGYTACFRKEAGAGGRDNRGMIRVHQFDKVEMVKFVAPETSWAELDSLLAQAEDCLQRLGIPYQIAQMCTGDVGFTAAKKFDPEAWMPGQGKYVEISSCSNFVDFQARRANIRYRPAPEAKPQFVHTLNGSGLAIGRTVAAILENYQQADGTVVVPEVLRPYMRGLALLTKGRAL
ncbi:MAG TPA: serine--tRNA ligase [Chloroflexia bacterium]|nr:serine--tRNA ligase [Chloroflexia bacterium]